MNIRQNRLIAKTVGMMGVGALAALISLPGFAQVRYDAKPNSETNNSTSPAPSAGTATTDPAYGNPGVQTPVQESRNPVGQTGGSMGGSPEGPSVVPNESNPGPSETPSGSPSVPGVSNQDDPGRSSGSSTRQEAYDSNRMQQPGGMNQMEGTTEGPSVVPDENIPGPSETPSGSPSVPGVSGQDDPSESSAPSTRQEAYDSNRMEQTQPGGMNQMEGPTEGPSVVPGEGEPGPSETPSGSPSVPGVSNQDDPGRSQ